MTRRVAWTLLLVGLPACDFPTEPPRWDQTWVVARIVVAATNLLPESVDVNADTTAFIAETPAAVIHATLADVCTTCLVVNGLRTPKPEFADTLATGTTLPSEIVSATLVGGAFDVVVGHNLNFDPLRPSADPTAPRGYMVFRVTSSGAVVAYDSISGNDTPFPGGTNLTPDLSVLPVEVSSSIDIEIYIYSPEGDSVMVQASDTAGITLHPSTVEISRVTLDAASIVVSPVHATLDFSGVDSPVIDHVQSGAWLVDVDNPWDITGTLEVTLEPPFPSIQRSLALEAGTYRDRLDLSGGELRAMLAAGEVEVEATGSIASPGNVVVTPAQELVVDGNLEFVVLIGGTEAP
jgi:hypothetical protein